MTTFNLADDAWVRRLFFALALLYVVPFWTVHYLPTVDGPCHTYNAWILRQYGNVEEYPLFQRYYEINTEPFPNWISHGVMALLMLAVPPLVAEKLLVSLYALLFLAGAWYLAGSVNPERRWPAFLAFPFVYNYLFQFGFYNFSISLALFLFILGFWWRRRERPDLSYAVGINLLLWLCYFSHILSFGLSLLAIAVLWLATLRRDNWRRHLLHVLILAPQILLPLWYFSVQGRGVVASSWSFRRLLRYFLELQGLFAFGRRQRRFLRVLAGAFWALALLTLWRENLRGSGRVRPKLREADAFLLLTVLFAVIYFSSPEGMSGGTLLKPRLSLYPYLVLIPWLSPNLGGRARRIATAVLAVAALLNAGYLIHWYGVLSSRMERYLSGLDPVRPDTRLLPLLLEHDTAGARVDVLGHAASYAALEKGLIDWDNYEATVWFFPIEFRATAPPPVIAEIEAQPGSLRSRPWKDRADYVYTWKMPPGHPLASRLDRFYDLISVENGGALWERRRRGRP
ncbi:MAG TPA: hypothetical protein VGG03_22390 [Thermoanaerobaculia bacterium]